MITLICRDKAKSPLKHWTSDWKTKQACLQDARGNALRTIAILTEEEIKAYGKMNFWDVPFDKRDIQSYCKDILYPPIMRAEWSEEERQEELKRLDAIVDSFKKSGKMIWEAYCFIKYGYNDISDELATRIWGREELMDIASHSYDEEDQKYDMERCGYTQEDVDNKLVSRGADSMIGNEMDICGDVNAGKDDMEFWIEDAYKRIAKKTYY